MYNMTKNDMIQEHSKLCIERMQMDKFFSLFLDKCGGKMDAKHTDTPVWKLYKNKMKEYATLQSAIKTLEYRIKRVQ